MSVQNIANYTSVPSVSCFSGVCAEVADRVRQIASRIASAVNRLFEAFSEKISSFKDWWDPRRHFVHALYAIPDARQRQHVLGCVLSLLAHPAISTQLQETLRQIVQDYPTDQNACIRNMLRVIPIDFDCEHAMKLIELMSEIQEEHRALIVNNENVKRLFLSIGVYAFENRLVFDKFIKKIHSSHIEHEVDNIFALANSILPENPPCDAMVRCVWALGSEHRIFRQDIVQVVQNLDLFLRQSRRYEHGSEILKQICAIPFDRREVVVEHVISFLRDVKDEKVLWIDARNLIHAIVDIPRNSIENVMIQVNRYVTQRGRINISIDHLNRMIEIIAGIPTEHREQVMNRLYENPNFHGQHNSDHVQQIRNNVRQIREAAMQREREQLRRNAPVQQRPTQGVNVHAGDRDQKTRGAIELLYQQPHQKRLSQRNMDTAWKEFTGYLACVEPLPRTHQDWPTQLASRALWGPMIEGEFFGPLIATEIETQFTVYGLEIRGQELICRLWIFASQLPDPVDVNNAKQGMITALQQSYENGCRVCNPGKTQRLVVAVLQGRLAGVQIEEEIPLSQAAIQLFFLKPSVQRAANREELQREVDLFLEQETNLSPVDRQRFVAAVWEYAALEGFDQP